MAQAKVFNEWKEVWVVLAVNFFFSASFSVLNATIPDISNELHSTGNENCMSRALNSTLSIIVTAAWASLAPTPPPSAAAVGTT